ncbi:MAG: hypothetical protein OEY67_04110 [Gammaproteobacteria bacterium]|nr:hypothetical protein [Gammaproteobacteria bacterium]
MPDDLPKAIIILLWLLLGVIVFGYLLMKHAALVSLAFALVYYGTPVLWQMLHRPQD